MSDTSADPPGLNLARLREHLERAMPGTVRGPLRAERIEGGRSNLTYVLSDDHARWVLRRPRSAMCSPPRTTWGASTA